MHFEQDQVLFEAGDTIDATYFPTSAVISIVVTLSSGQAAMVGRDGVIGASAALDGKVALSRAVSRQNTTKYGGCNVYGQPSLGTDLEYYEVTNQTPRPAPQVDLHHSPK